MKQLKKSEGAISIFLCIIMLGVIILSSVLVEGARMKSAETQIQNALDSAAKSALANYDKILKDMYGLMAISDNDPEKLVEEVIYYLERNLNIPQLDEKNFFGKNGVNDNHALDLYDFKIEALNVKPVYNLSEPEVLRAQILEYMKYRAPKQLAEGLADKFMSIKDFKKQADIMTKKLDVDKALDDIRKQQLTASDNVMTVNNFGTDCNIPNQLEIAAGYIKERISLEKSIKDLEEQKENYKQDIDRLEKIISEKKAKAAGGQGAESKSQAVGTPKASGAPATPDISGEQKQIQELEKKIDDINKQIATKTAELNQKKESLKRINNELRKNVDKALNAASTAKSALISVKNDSKKTVEKIDGINIQLKGEVNEFSNTTRVDLGGKKEKISAEDLDPKISDLEFNITRLNIIKNYIINGKIDTMALGDFNGQVPDIDLIRQKLGIDGVKKEFNEYKGKRNSQPIDYYVDKGNVSSERKEDEKDPREFFADFIKGDDMKPKIEESTKKMPEDVPSNKGFKATGTAEIDKDRAYIDSILKEIKSMDYKITYALQGRTVDFTETDTKDATFKDNDISFSKNCFSTITKLADIFANGIQPLRDEIYIDEYIMGSFKNYTTGKTDEDEPDIRGNPMKDRPVFFSANNADVEYIIGGKESESDNINTVKGQLMLVRFALNAIAVYTDPTKSNFALEAAVAIAGWTGFGVPIVHTLIMMAWAMLESVFDVYYLMKGHSVAIFKTSDTWITSAQGGLTKLKDEFINSAKVKAKDKLDEVIDYTVMKTDNIANGMGKKLVDYIDSKVELYVDKAFQKIEKPIHSTMDSVNDIFIDFEKSINVNVEGELGKIIQQINDELQKLIPAEIETFLNGKLGDYASEQLNSYGVEYLDIFKQYKDRKVSEVLYELREKLAKGETILNNTVEETSQKINSLIFNTINATKYRIKNTLKEKVKELKDSFVEKFNNMLENAAEAGKGKINQLIDSVGNTTEGTAMKTNLRASFLSMSYSDYLRLFLLLTEKDKKIKRIADLIQVNMRDITGKSDFKMADCDTYIRTEAKVSAKYMFLSQPFIPEEYKTKNGKRMQFGITLYKGY
jgi:tetrahydromethanopterin S-methyltransferase subunit G